MLDSSLIDMTIWVGLIMSSSFSIGWNSLSTPTNNNTIGLIGNSEIVSTMFSNTLVGYGSWYVAKINKKNTISTSAFVLQC